MPPANTTYTLPEVMEISILQAIGRGLIDLPTLGLGQVLGDLRDDDFVVISARGGTGKTFLMLQMALDTATTGTPVMFFSGEMSAGDLGGTRLMRMFPQTRDLPKDALPSVKLEAIKRLPDIPIFFPDILERWPFRQTCMKIMDEAREKHGIKAFFFDHLRFFQNEPTKEMRDERALIEQTVLDMRLYAKQHRTPIILAVQPRQIHSDEEATIDTLKGTSAISQDATNVLILDRPRKKKSTARNAKDDNLDEVEVYEPYVYLKVEKARHAAGNARLKLYLDFRTGRFVEWSKGGAELSAKHKLFGT